MDTSGETLGERIKRLRTERELTQAELAARIPVDHATLSRWETDRRKPRGPAMWHALAAALGVGVEEVRGDGLQAAPAGVQERRSSTLAPLRQAIDLALTLGDPGLLAELTVAVQAAVQRRLRAGVPRRRGLGL